MSMTVQFTCPDARYHGNPFRYCPVKGCGWTEPGAPPATAVNVETDRLIRLAGHGVHSIARDQVHVGASATDDSLLIVFDVAVPTGRTIVVHFPDQVDVNRLRFISELALSYCAVEARAVEARWELPPGLTRQAILHLTPPEATR